MGTFVGHGVGIWELPGYIGVYMYKDRKGVTEGNGISGYPNP